MREKCEQTPTYQYSMHTFTFVCRSPAKRTKELQQQIETHSRRHILWLSSICFSSLLSRVVLISNFAWIESNGHRQLKADSPIIHAKYSKHGKQQAGALL